MLRKIKKALTIAAVVSAIGLMISTINFAPKHHMTQTGEQDSSVPLMQDTTQPGQASSITRGDHKTQELESPNRATDDEPALEITQQHAALQQTQNDVAEMVGSFSFEQPKQATAVIPSQQALMASTFAANKSEDSDPAWGSAQVEALSKSLQSADDLTIDDIACAGSMCRVVVKTEGDQDDRTVVGVIHENVQWDGEVYMDLSRQGSVVAYLGRYGQRLPRAGQKE